jgi:hypothetical protein
VVFGESLAEEVDAFAWIPGSGYDGHESVLELGGKETGRFWEILEGLVVIIGFL